MGMCGESVSRDLHFGIDRHAKGSDGRAPERGGVSQMGAHLFALENLDGVIASTSICFDLSVFEIFAPLTIGGRVIVVDNVLALAGMDTGLAPKMVNTVPSAMAELLRLGGLPETIRIVNLAGELLTRKLVDELYQHRQVQQVYDLYGPSETTTYSSYTERTAGGPQTIGRPIANTQIYILDPYGNPSPIGMPGEIYIGGAGVARGYFNRPELTAEKFIPNPFSSEINSRLYRTGDLGRFLPDGKIELVGRTDHQVKVRGFRIELGEIESVLSQHPEVRDAVVAVREDRPGDKVLIAYVVGLSGSSVEADQLKQFLRARLPAYMIPSGWVRLASFPQTPNGKIDRAALPAPEESDYDRTEFIAPRTHIERMLASIWRSEPAAALRGLA